MKEQIQKAIDDMKSKVGRDSKHIYINNETGDWLQGVSTVSSIVPKDWLSAWGAKETVKFLGYSDYEGDVSVAETMLKKIKNLDIPAYLRLLKEAKGASMRKSKQALVDGKAGHDWIENFVLAKITAKNTPALPGGLLDRPLTQFMEWEAKEIDYWIASEVFVCRLDKKYAGQLDAIAMMKSGKLALIDFKFASGISEDYYLQTAGYAACFEPYGIKFDDRIIVRLPKTVEMDSWNKELYKYEKVPNNIEVKSVPTPYEIDREAFFCALPLKQWINFVTKNN